MTAQGNPDLTKLAARESDKADEATLRVRHDTLKAQLDEANEAIAGWQEKKRELLPDYNAVLEQIEKRRRRSSTPSTLTPKDVESTTV